MADDERDLVDDEEIEEDETDRETDVDDDEDLDDDRDADDLDEDADASLSEGAATPEAPWAPLPTWLARAYQQENPDAVIDLIFPAVYEEDRSVLLKDLITSQEAQFITHRRAAEQGAKELGVENYDYGEEQDNIRAERKAGVGAPPLGAGDALGGALARPPAGLPEERRRDDFEPKRADVSGVVQAQLRRDMRQAEAAVAELQREVRALREARAAPPADGAALASLAQELRGLREVLASRDGDERGAVLAQLSEALARVVERVGPAAVTVNPAAVTVQPAAVTVGGPTVNVPAQPAPVVNVEVAPSAAPDVRVDVHAPEPRPVRFEHDPATGAITRSVPEEPER